jgi:hypothetical protein
MNLAEWFEVISWWLVALDCCGYNILAWAKRDWYVSRFPKCSRVFPVTKAFGAFYGVLMIWLGTALLRAGYPLLGG